MLRYEFELIMQNDFKPKMSVEDFRCLFRYHWIDELQDLVQQNEYLRQESIHYKGPRNAC